MNVPLLWEAAREFTGLRLVFWLQPLWLDAPRATQLAIRLVSTK